MTFWILSYPPTTNAFGLSRNLRLPQRPENVFIYTDMPFSCPPVFHRHPPQPVSAATAHTRHASKETGLKRPREPGVDPAKAKLPMPAPTNDLPEPAGNADDIKSARIPEDRLLWLKGAEWNNYLPSSAAAARALHLSGFPMDMLVPTGEYIKGWVAIGNNGEPHEKTKSYRLVTFSAEAKKDIKAFAEILGEERTQEEWGSAPRLVVVAPADFA
jgi:hypothetical protein